MSVGGLSAERIGLIDTRMIAGAARGRPSRPAAAHERRAHPHVAFSPRSACACGGGCPRCAALPKLKIGASSDPLERAADRVADHVMRGGYAESGSSEAVDRSSDRTGSSDDARQVAPAAMSSDGLPLPIATRAFFEPRLGRDLSDVRVHTGEAAAQDNESLGARAFTVGNHISLARGESVGGTPLLAHELAHVAQNEGRAPDTIRRKEDWDYTPAEYAALKKGKGDLKIASDSSWVPTALQDNILNTLRYTLDPQRSPAATEGVNVVDFYHGHLVVPDNDKGLSIDAMDARSKFKKELEKQTTKALGGEYEKVTAKNVGAYTKGIKATLPLLAKAMDEVMKIKGAAVMYHTYEMTAQDKGIKPHDPRRNYVTPFDTNVPKPYQLPKGAKDYTDQYVHYLEFTFLVDENGEVHVRPGGRDPLSTITGAPIAGQ